MTKVRFVSLDYMGEDWVLWRQADEVIDRLDRERAEYKAEAERLEAELSFWKGHAEMLRAANRRPCISCGYEQKAVVAKGGKERGE